MARLPSLVGGGVEPYEEDLGSLNHIDSGRPWGLDKELGLPSLDEDQVLEVWVARIKAKKRKKFSKSRRNKCVAFKTRVASHARRPSENVASEELADSKKEVFNEAKNTWNLGKSLG